MSIASLMDEDFKHKFKDDMESFYYVIIYASVLWLPHKEVDDVERRVSRFFDEYEVNNGKAEGGMVKMSNLYSGAFHRIWNFRNSSLQQWLTRVLEIQWPYGELEDWTPEALSNQWKITDEEDLPEDDRIDHISMIRMEKDRLALLQSSNRAIDKLEQSGHTLDVPEKISPLSSKRSAEDAKLEERSDSSKRQCRPCYWVDPREECREVIVG